MQLSNMGKRQGQLEHNQAKQLNSRVKLELCLGETLKTLETPCLHVGERRREGDSLGGHLDAFR